MLTVLRFFTGLGIGGAFPGAATLTGDYAPHRLRATMIMASFTGAPIGGFVGGQIVAVLLPHFGWPVIFLLGGVFPLVLVPVLALWLPESPRFLARKANLSPREAALLAAPRHRRRAERSCTPSTSPMKIRSRCCSARAMRYRPSCSG